MTPCEVRREDSHDDASNALRPFGVGIVKKVTQSFFAGRDSGEMSMKQKEECEPAT
jgi:hypothetical protein